MVRQFKQLGEGKLCFYSKSSVEYCSKALKVKVFCVVSNTPVEQKEKLFTCMSIQHGGALSAADSDTIRTIGLCSENAENIFCVLSYSYQTDTQVNLIELFVHNRQIEFK